VGFIVDFYCHKAGLVVELDGDIHDLQQEEDARREKVLREMGLRIVRCGEESPRGDIISTRNRNDHCNNSKQVY
jgi:very-short-patch-repair endonuclease